MEQIKTGNEILNVLKALDALYQFTTNVQAPLASHLQAQGYYNLIKNHLMPMPQKPELKTTPPVVESKISSLKQKPPGVK